MYFTFETEIWPYLIHESRVFGVEVFFVKWKIRVSNQRKIMKR